MDFIRGSSSRGGRTESTYVRVWLEVTQTDSQTICKSWKYLSSKKQTKKTAFTKPFKDFPNLMSLMLLFLGGQIITLASCLQDLWFLYGGVFQECFFCEQAPKKLGVSNNRRPLLEIFRKLSSIWRKPAAGWIAKHKQQRHNANGPRLLKLELSLQLCKTNANSSSNIPCALPTPLLLAS